MEKPLKIAFFGSSLVSAYWNGAATYYRGIVRALAQRGHHVTFFEPDAYDRQRHRDIPDPEWADVIVYDAERADKVLHTVRLARDADVVIKASGVGVHDELLESAVIESRRPGMLIVFWDVDAPATLQRVQSNLDDPFRELIPEYDLVLTYGGGDPVMRAYESLGAQRCHAIYNALDPTTHFRVPPEPRFSTELAFLGNRLPDREARVDEFFFRAAELLPQRTFLLGGSGWQDKPRPSNVNYVGHVYTAEHNALNCSAQAVLNINRQSMAQFGFSPPTRIFEAAGVGACLITDAWEGIEMFLEPGREVMVARNADEVAEYMERLTLPMAATIGEAARRRVMREHTYEHRVRELETILARVEPVRTAHLLTTR